MLAQLTPYIGYLGSLLLALGLLVNNDLKFRWLNSAGCVVFIVYGILLNAVPIILTNAILLSINIVYLYKMYGRKEQFELIEFTPDNKIIEKFITFYQEDIAEFFPGFQKNDLQGKLNFIVLRDLVIANIFSTKVSETGDAEVIINYTIPKYRDYKVGRFIFEKEHQFLISKGVKNIVYKNVHNPKTEKFLNVMTFEKNILPDGISYNKRLIK